MAMTGWHAPSADRPRSVTILGATGSVGRSTVDLIARDPERYRVEALVAGNRRRAGRAGASTAGTLAVIGDGRAIAP